MISNFVKTFLQTVTTILSITLHGEWWLSLFLLKILIKNLNKFKTQVNSPFGMRLLASSRGNNYTIIFTCEHQALHKTLKINHFSVTCHR